MPVTWPRFTKITNSGSRNRIPGNIWVDSTAIVNTPRPRNRYRLTAYAASSATTTDATDAVVDTIRLFTRYRPSGIVDHMATNGDSVRWLGNQRNTPSTSGSGLSAEVSIT